MDTDVSRASVARKGSPYLSPDQAAFYLGLSERTLRRRRKSGDGPPYRRHCRHLRYHIDDLDAWSRHMGSGDHG